MRRASATTITCALVVLLAVPTVSEAHGGAYRGPSGSVPPDRREPNDAPPPPGHWGRGGDREPRSDDVPRVVAGFEDWSFWWERRSDAVLDAAVAGRDRKLDRDEVRRWVIPALRGLLRDPELNFDIGSASAVALARIGDAECAEILRSIVTGQSRVRTDDRVHKVLEETTALALGLLDDGEAQSTRDLREILADTDRNASFVRPFCAIGLAVREQDGPVGGTPEALIAGLWRPERKYDVRPATLIALGVLGDDVCREAIAEVALCEPDDPRYEILRPHDRAAALAALGVVRDADAAVEVLMSFLDRDERHVLRREAVLALGSAAGRAGASVSSPVLQRLIGMLATAEDPAAQRPVAPEHVVQAIGRIAESSGGAGDAARAFLASALRTEERPSVRANVAICLGMAVRSSGSGAASGTAALRSRFSSTDEPQERAAYALALGLVGDHEAIPALRAVVGDVQADGALRGYSGLALGFLGSGEHEIVTLAGSDNEYLSRIQAHLALGLLGGDRARETSLAVFTSEEGEDHYLVLGAAAWSIGVNPDMDSLAALTVAAEDRDAYHADITRALAVVAVGRACARSGAPTLQAVRDALPHRVLPPAILEFLTIL